MKPTLPVLMLAILAGCERADTSQVGSADSSARPVASAAPARTPAPARFPCLALDSLRAARDTLHYSGLRVHEETGDVLGPDLQLTRRGSEWTGRIAFAEGVLGEYSPTHAASLDTATGALTLAWDFHGRPASFHGTLNCATLVGEFVWGPGVDPKVDTLPRQR